MKNRILLTAALCMSMMAEITAQGYTSLREQIQLAGEWESSLGTCRLPGTTDENRLGERNRDTLVTYQLTRLYPYSGKVIYTREINIPESFRGKKLFLMMERTKPSTVWVDGDSIGSYGHLYAPHRYELPALAVGKHQLKIRIDNSPTSVPKEIQGSHAWTDATQTNWNGILGEFYIEAVPVSYIQSVQVYPEVDKKQALVIVEVDADKDGKAILDVDGYAWNTSETHTLSPQQLAVRLKKGRNRIELPVNMGDKPLLWSEFHPALYKLNITLRAGKNRDSRMVDFGMRKFEVEGTQFVINGYKTFLRGKHDACVFPLTGYGPMDVASWQRVFRVAKQYGINHYRCHSFTPPRAALEAADIEGIYYQIELPLWGYIKRENTVLNDFLKREGDMLLEHFGNHPSFMMLGLGNELDAEIDVVREWLDDFRNQDNRHLYCFGSNNKLDNVKRNLAVGWAVRDYIESGKSILFTHDTTSYVNNIQSAIQWNDQGYKEDQKNYWYWGYEFNKTIRASVGLDRYGALKEYYQQRAASTTGEEQKRDQEYLKTLESYTFDEIKEPNSDNELWQKEGVTKYTVVRFLRSYLEDLRKTGSSEVWFPVKNSLLKQAGYDGGDPRWNYPSSLLMGDYAGSSLIATQVNDGQITQYPYQISADEQLEISNTHYQWLQPNMELDRNGDGKNDIVVWYCISGVADGNYKNTNIYNITPNDVVNNYYIYTMGNVTYSGAGHSTPSKESEIKLFVNTMIAAYNAGVTAPSVRFKDKSGSKIQSVYMLYDPVNHIVLDDKNNGTISVNFQADDYNILAGGQQLCVEFYKSCADDTSGAISVDGITGKVLRLKTDGEDGLKITDSNGNVILPIERNGVKNCYPITNGATYTLKYSSDEMGLFSTDTSGTILNEGAQASTIYARVYTVYDSGSKVTPCGIAELSISAQELFELD